MRTGSWTRRVCMYTYEQRMTAVNLYFKYYHKDTAVIQERGYPNRHVLVQWLNEYEATEDLHQSSKLRKKSKYSEEQKQAALKFYRDYSRSITLTINMLGYPEKNTFKQWLNEAFPDRKKYCVFGGGMVEYSQEKKSKLLFLCARNGSAVTSRGVSCTAWSLPATGTSLSGRRISEKRIPSCAFLTAFFDDAIAFAVKAESLQRKRLKPSPCGWSSPIPKAETKFNWHSEWGDYAFLDWIGCFYWIEIACFCRIWTLTCILSNST